MKIIIAKQIEDATKKTVAITLHMSTVKVAIICINIVATYLSDFIKPSPNISSNTLPLSTPRIRAKTNRNENTNSITAVKDEA